MREGTAVKQAEGKSEVRKRRVSRSKRAKRTEAKRAVSIIKRNGRISKEPSHIPYTMEPHPEL
jgi:hypothetical protein